MNGRPKIEEQYKKGSDVINFIVYNSTTGAEDDEVLQHKILGTTETAHITLHPDGSINFQSAGDKPPPLGGNVFSTHPFKGPA